MPLNRIYQGRVTACHDAQGNTINNFAEILFSHHQLFQDAVNYYLFALVAMSMESDEIFGKIKHQLREVWNDFERNGELRPGLKHSIFRIYSTPEILDPENGFNFAENLVLDNCTVAPEILQAALTHIAEKCSGDVTQPSKTYFPQLCCTSFHGNWDLDKKSFEQNIGKNKLIEALYSTDPVDRIKPLIPEMDIGWCGVKTKTGEFFNGKDALTELENSIKYFLSSDKLRKETESYLSSTGRNKLLEYQDKIADLKDVRFGKHVGGNRNFDDKNAMWLLRFFPDDFTVGLMKSIIKEKEKNTKLQPPVFGDDPIKLSRGTRGYVFKPFTELPLWENESDWRSFDMEAFQEALKTINQFNQKSKERNGEYKKYRDAIEWMEGITTSAKPPSIPDADELYDDDNNVSLPKLTADTRWKKLNNLLHNELAVQNCWTEDEVVEYGLSERTIRSFKSLKTQWEKIITTERQKGTNETSISIKLKKALEQFQSQHNEAMGSAPLFQALCKPENYCIWEDDYNCKEKFSSSNILQDSVRYNYYKQRLLLLEEPIRLTPADARLSRRMNNLVAVSNGKDLGHKGACIFIARLAVKNNEKFHIEKIKISYSSPRLRRDGLLNGTAESFYAPPVLQSLFPEQPEKQIFDPAVFLMPDWDKNGNLRLLLNFPVKLTIEKLRDNFDQRFRGKNEFYFCNDVNSALLWPDYKYEKEPTWYKSGEDFSFVAVDLGQRSAGALVRIKISAEMSEHSIFIGNDGTRQWYAKRTYCELMRLPGEDAKVFHKGKFQKEEYGKHGRTADKEESLDAIEIFRLLKEDESMLYPDGKNIIPYYPIQNDKLLIALRRAIGKLKLLDRWLWLFSEKEMSDKLTEELNAADWLPVKTKCFIESFEQELRQILPQVLAKISNRILPVREKIWQWREKYNHQNIHYWQLCLINSPGNKPKIRGQRGLSFARLTQLEDLRKRCQALNRLLMREPGEQPQSVSDMRKLILPDCCPDILRRLEEMKEQRINQTANMILCQALGLRRKPHTSSIQECAVNCIHGEYEKIPGVAPASFIVLENLSRYKFSQDRSPYENSRLMKWSHRALVDKLKMLCEITGVPILEVNAAYSSKFSAESIPGFRANECNTMDIDTFARIHKRLSSQEDALLEAIFKNHMELCKYDSSATSILPWDGGEIFVPFCGTDDLKQADINAAFNIGLRAVANGKNLLICNRLSAERKKEFWQVKRNSKFSKMIYPEEIKIIYNSEKKLLGGNFFVIACDPRILNSEDDPIPCFAENSDQTGFLMFGSSIWRNLTLQLERCLQLNKERLKKLVPNMDSLL